MTAYWQAYLLTGPAPKNSVEAMDKASDKCKDVNTLDTQWKNVSST